MNNEELWKKVLNSYQRMIWSYIENGKVASTATDSFAGFGEACARAGVSDNDDITAKGEIIDVTWHDINPNIKLLGDGK